MLKPESVEAIQMSTPEEVLDTRTPEQIEQDLIKKHEQQALDAVNKMAPADIAASFFQQFYPLFKMRLAALSNKDARRVIDALVQWPLEDSNPKFNSDTAKEVFGLGIRLIDAKTIMRDTVEMEQIEQRKKDLDNNQEMGDNTHVAEQPQITSEFTKGEESDIKENE